MTQVRHPLTLKKNNPVNFGYFHWQRGDPKVLINNVAAEALDLKGQNIMQDDLKMGNHDINNLKNLKVNGTLEVSGISSFDGAMTIWGDVTLNSKD